MGVRWDRGFPGGHLGCKGSQAGLFAESLCGTRVPRSPPWATLVRHSPSAASFEPHHTGGGQGRGTRLPSQPPCLQVATLWAVLFPLLKMSGLWLLVCTEVP